MRVLIGCEFSGVTRRAFREAGHDAYSCDVLPSEDNSPHHIQADVRTLLYGGFFELGIFHPDCTYLTLAGARWFTDPRPQYADRREKQREALDFFELLQNAPIPRICVENPQPLGVVMERLGRYTQKIQPWEFGIPETKGLCFWLKGLPPLKPTGIVAKRTPRVWRMGPGPNRKRERSRSYPGIARAMATQWGDLDAGFFPQPNHRQ